jgi:SPP1 family phage portal protein
MEKLRYKFDDRLTDEQIIGIVDAYKKDVVPEVLLKEAYSRGNNPSILTRQVPAGAPDNKIPTPYARRITSLVSSYMFAPGLITYNSENQAYFEQLDEIFKANKEPLETYKIGWQSTVQGVGYEMFSNEGIEVERTIDNQVGYARTVPRFEKVPVAETIPIYNFDVTPEMQAFIRFYMVESEEVEHIDVYYSDVVVHYLRKKNQHGLIIEDEQEHGYDKPPLVVYDNNDDLMGDFQAVVPLIDAYDVLMSDSMNEFDRFAQAYLVAKGFTISQDDVEKLKHKRAFSLLNNEDSIEFLTKPIEVEFIKFVSEQLRGEIHRGSGIPNLDDYKWGSSASGETLDKWIYLMELFTGIKQAYFKEGLQQRIEMLTAYAGLGGTPEEIEIVMNRNDPDKSMLLADLMGKYAGHVSERTLLENFADFVTDVDAELEQLRGEKSEKIDLMREEFAAKPPVAGEPVEEPVVEEEA